MKMKMPLMGPVISKVAISRFARTLGTLVSSGVPILQALNIVKRGRTFVIVQPKQQEIGDGGIVEFARNIRMGPYAIEGVAEQKEIF